MDVETRIQTFVKKIRPPHKTVKNLESKRDALIVLLKKEIAKRKYLTLHDIVPHGSLKKDTAVWYPGYESSDLDIAVYFERGNLSKPQIRDLRDILYRCIARTYRPETPQIYPMKSAVRVEFYGQPKLKVDLVPIVLDPRPGMPDRGIILREDGTERVTSIQGHLHFMHSRSRMSQQAGTIHFNDLVRLFKLWSLCHRRSQDVHISSYFSELLVAEMFDQWGLSKSWLESLIRLYGHICMYKLRRPIFFTYAYHASALPKDPHLVQVFDAIDPNNNVTKKWTKYQLVTYLQKVQETYDLLLEIQYLSQSDQHEQCVALLCKIFGKQFRTLSTL